jgi:hypothetical protein
MPTCRRASPPPTTAYAQANLTPEQLAELKAYEDTRQLTTTPAYALDVVEETLGRLAGSETRGAPWYRAKIRQKEIESAR